MGWMDEIDDIVSRYAGGSGGAACAPANPHRDYCDIASSAPLELMAEALSWAFRSDRTPSFPEMVSSLFRQSNPDQRAGLLSQLVEAAGPTAPVGLPVHGAKADPAGGCQSVAPGVAIRVTADQVRRMACQAERNDPSIIERVSIFYAQYPGVVKALGTTAITVALQHIAAARR